MHRQGSRVPCDLSEDAGFISGEPGL